MKFRWIPGYGLKPSDKGSVDEKHEVGRFGWRNTLRMESQTGK